MPDLPRLGGFESRFVEAAFSFGMAEIERSNGTFAKQLSVFAGVVSFPLPSGIVVNVQRTGCF
ncbi:hypothetical protein [Polaromonas aquatica]|uniref:hypothetical protein n=1 Tax=Polaromonas aquatica TaxID=332657 RepID=UPI003D647450